MLFTIAIPLLITAFAVPITFNIVPIFLLLFVLFYIINKNSHHLYLSNFELEDELTIEQEKKWLRGNKKKSIKYSFYLFCTVIVLFIIGNLLSNTLEELAFSLSVPEFILGVTLGFITSVPELITFFESQSHHKKSSSNQEGVIEATNNLLTSNIMNLFIIQSLALILIELL